MSQIHLDGNSLGFWHSSHRHRLHCGHVIEFNGSPFDECKSMSSCNVAVAKSFVNGIGCFVIADIGNTDGLDVVVVVVRAGTADVID